MENRPTSYSDKLARYFSLWIVIITALVIGGYIIYSGQPGVIEWWPSAILFFLIDLVPFAIGLVLMYYLSQSVWQTCVMLAGFVVSFVEVFLLLHDTFQSGHPYALAGLTFFDIPIMVSVIMGCALMLMLILRWFMYLSKKQ